MTGKQLILPILTLIGFLLLFKNHISENAAD